MYEELKKQLKELGLITEFCGEQRCFECKNEDLCDKYENKMLSDVYKNAARAIERLELEVAALKTDKDYLVDENRKLVEAWQNALGGQKWISVEDRLPDCEWDSEIGNVEWISNGKVYAGCFGRGGKWRDAYFREWKDGTEGIDAKDAQLWRIVSLPEPPKEE